MAEAVVNTEQLFKGKILGMKLLGREMKENVETLGNKENSGEKESTTVEVSGLPVGCTKSSVLIHFQKRKNGGGEVEKAEMLRQGKARVIFQDPRGRFPMVWLAWILIIYSSCSQTFKTIHYKHVNNADYDIKIFPLIIDSGYVALSDLTVSVMYD